MICVNAAKMRTTSSVEAYNGVLNKTLQTHGHFFNFVHDMRAEDFFKRDELIELIKSGNKTAKKRRAEYKVIYYLNRQLTFLSVPISRPNLLFVMFF